MADDAAALAEVHVRAWQAAYRDDMPAAFLDSLDVAKRTVAWTGWLAAAEHPSTFLVGELDDRVVGFAVVGVARGGSAEARTTDEPGELWALNVHPDAWRRGVGAALLTAAETALAVAGHRSATLWVVTGNERARRFYDAHGWRPSGEARVERDGPADAPFDISETRYVKPLP